MTELRQHERAKGFPTIHGNQADKYKTRLKNVNWCLYDSGVPIKSLFKILLDNYKNIIDISEMFYFSLFFLFFINRKNIIG